MFEKQSIGLVDTYMCDCMDFMRSTPDNRYDLAIVDPPYFDGPNKSGYYGKGYSNLGVQRARHYDSLDCWEIPTKEYFEELARVSKNQIIFGVNHFANAFDASSSCWIVWDKDNGKSSFADAELAYTSFKTAVRIFKYRWQGMIQGYHGDKSKNEERIHPTQKPIALYEWILHNYAKPGQAIFDSHFGSGSLGVACNRLGFSLDATEIDPLMFMACTKRLKEQLKHAQDRLFV